MSKVLITGAADGLGHGRVTRRLRRGLTPALVALLCPATGISAPPSPVLAPPAAARFSYQIGGAFSPPPGAQIIDRDRHAQPVPGRYDICYLNAFQAQPEELAWWRAHHHRLLLFARGRAVIDTTWNEQLLDTSTVGKRAELAGILAGWIRGCARTGYQAVEPDNLDSWQRSMGHLTRRDNLALAALLIRRAHAAGLAIAQKNTAEVAGAGRRLGFDFAIAEECQVYSECGAYTRAYGREVIEIEYQDNGGEANFGAACRARGSAISIILRDRNVTPAGRRGFVERRCL